MKKLQHSIYYLEELNYRMAYAAFGTALLFFTSYTYKQSLIFAFLPVGLSYFVTTGLTEIFLTYIKLCTILSLGFGIGIAIVQMYLFLRPGLYAYEAKKSFNILLASIFFYISLYTYILPATINVFWRIFSTYSQNFTPIDLTFEPKLADYLEQLQQLSHVLSFIFPCLVLLNQLQALTQRHIWVKYRRIFYLIGFSIGALLTPPDIMSQILVGTPLIILYEVQTSFWVLHKEYHNQLLIRQPVKPYKDTNGKKKQCQREW
uniref:SecY-independent transporter protein n=1 Tax=Chorda asiatica TaxID=1281577 RepID=A0A8F0FCE8_9PHAE|nr:SecY-independent transporter protein [Chorda asiatica]